MPLNKKANNMFKWISIGCLSALTFTSCVSRYNDTVLERSAQERPAWTQGDFSTEGEAQIFLSYERTDIYRLELGIKQAQLAAVQETKKLLLNRVSDDLVRKSEDLYKTKRSSLMSAIGQAVQDISQAYKPPEAMPRTVYWEHISQPTTDGTRTFYNVYVLLTMTRDEYANAMLKVLTHMQNSQSAEAQAFAKTILNENASN